MKSLALTLFCLATVGALQRWDLSSSPKFNFTLSSCDGNYTNIAASVPGLVHTDLISAGVVSLDPYYRYEEVNLGWIPQSCWSYQTSFSLSRVDSESALFLRFEGLESVSTVYVNDAKVGSSANSFRTHTFEVDQSLLKRDNVLRVEFADVLSYMKAQAALYPYAVPATENWNVWVEPSSRPFLRKAGSDMGWDWGPAYAPSGISGPVYFFQEPSQAGKLEGLSVVPAFSEDLSSAVLAVQVRLSAVPLADYSVVRGKKTAAALRAVPIVVLIDGVERLSATLEVGREESEVVAVGSVALSDIKLWWPIGTGAQHLYTVTVQYNRDQSLTRQIGLRKVELVQDPITTGTTSTATAADGTSLYTVQPASFYFRINGVPVFMRGANFIPIDSFESRVTAADREYVLRSAASANMNMVRVWGGGRYQADDFYALADQMGIMVWQEVMLACALYPRDAGFLGEISAEVTEQAFRLGTHPSIVVWGGNNENEVALGWFSESNTNRDLYVADYAKLYGDTVYPALSAVIGAAGSAVAAWVDSSPSNGLVSTEPYVKQWGSASTALAGDVHFYDYSCDCEAYTSYPQARFVSEFGFQTMPSFLAYQPVSGAADWDKDSDLMAYRQRHENGNSQIEAQMVRHFNLPADCSASSDSRSFDMYLYLTGLQQSRCYETAVDRWRQLRSQEANTMGILYWQLNDIWQGPSWASIEWGGRWKPVQYAVRRAYSPVAVTAQALPAAGNKFDLYVVNDLLDAAADMQITVELVPWKADGRRRYWWVTGSGATVVPADSSKWVLEVNVDANLGQFDCTRETCYVKVTSSYFTASNTALTPLWPTYTFLAPIKDAVLEQPSVITIGSVAALSDTQVSFTVSVDVSSPFIFLELQDDTSASGKISTEGVFGANAGWFSDNNFLAEAGVVYSLTYTSHSAALDVKAFSSRVQARVLQSAYACDAVPVKVVA